MKLKNLYTFWQQGYIGNLAWVLPLWLWAITAQAQIGYTEQGMASFYAQQFNGKRTASGERFDVKAYTAAHRQLPFGAMVKVTNLSNNQSVTVRINDRGPFKPTRIIDLSPAAARELDLIRMGTAEVSLEVVGLYGKVGRTEPETTTQAVTAPTPTALKKERPKPEKVKPFGEKGNWTLAGERSHPGRYGLQVGHFSELARATELARKLAMPKTYIVVEHSGKTFTYGVLVGTYKSKSDAHKAIPPLEKKGIKAFVAKYV